jgi:hypothetical protein
MTVSSTSSRLVGKSGVAPIVHTNRLHDAEVRKGERLAGALLVKAVATVPTVMFPVGKGECGPASHTYVRVNPFRRLNSVSI